MGTKIGAYKAKSGFGKKGYKPGKMITTMNKMNAGAASGVGRLQKAKNADYKIVN